MPRAAKAAATPATDACTRTSLNLPKYPEASFSPDHMEGKVEITGTSNVKLHGTFKIHGTAHEITVPVQVTAKDDRITAIIKFDVPYVAWGMKNPDTLFLKVDKSVEIDMQLTGSLSAVQ